MINLTCDSGRLRYNFNRYNIDCYNRILQFFIYCKSAPRQETQFSNNFNIEESGYDHHSKENNTDLLPDKIICLKHQHRFFYNGKKTYFSSEFDSVELDSLKRQVRLKRLFLCLALFSIILLWSNFSFANILNRFFHFLEWVHFCLQLESLLWPLVSTEYRWPSLFAILVFAVLTILGLENKVKPKIMRGPPLFYPHLSLQCGFRYSRIIFLMDVFPANNEGNLYSVRMKLLHHFQWGILLLVNWIESVKS